MAAHVWRWVLLAELAFAAAAGWLGAVVFDLPAYAAPLVAVLALVALYGLFIGVTLGTALASRRVSGGSGWLLHALRAWLTEMWQFAHAQIAMSAIRSARRVHTGCDSGERGGRAVLLLHGILCNHEIWRDLRVRLNAAGFAAVRSLDLEPLNASIDAYARRARREIMDLHRHSGGASVAVVAHSMGGLVARAVLDSIEPGMIDRVITVATPHHGSRLAHCLKGTPSALMRSSSRWLQALNAAQEGRLPVSLTSIYSLEDNFIAPPESAELLGAEMFQVRGLGHFGLLSSRRVIDHIMRVLGERNPS